MSAGTNQGGVQWSSLQSHLTGGAVDHGHEGGWSTFSNYQWSICYSLWGKIELAGSVIKMLYQNKYLSQLNTSDTAVVEQTPIIVFRDDEEEEEERSNPFASLLKFYCSKALDFFQPVVFQEAFSQVPSKLY